MENNQNLIREAFSFSKKGSRMCFIEGFIIGLLLSLLFLHLMGPARDAIDYHQYTRNTRIASFLIATFISLVLGRTGISLISWRIFSPTEKQIQDYKDYQIRQLNLRIQKDRKSITESQKQIEQLKK